MGIVIYSITDVFYCRDCTARRASRCCLFAYNVNWYDVQPSGF